MSYQSNLEEFFAYAKERERVRLAKESGASRPWTIDTALGQFRFCNVYREDDRTTRWITENIREPVDKTDPLGLPLAMTIANFINRIESLDLVKDLIVEGYHVNRARFHERLKDVNPVVTGAYVIHSEIGMPKLEGCMFIFDWYSKSGWEELAKSIEPGKTTLEEVHKWLMEVKNVGAFMAYEIVTALRHTSLLRDAPDILTWASPGPGAARGLDWLYRDEADRKPFSYGSKKQRAIMNEEMQKILAASRDPANWPNQDRPWEMREVEHTLCEYDKWCRVTHGGKRMKRRYP